LQRAGKDIIQLQRSRNTVSDLVDGLQFPHQSTVIKFHLPPFDGPVDRGKQLIDIKGFLYESERG
jgi:hypothetical protein